MKKSIIGVLSLFPFSVFADIEGLTVNDLTISWTVGGWMQVQDSSTYQTVSGCEGLIASCLVEPGTYHVVNHTKGDRQEFLTIGSSDVVSGSNPDGITVNGNRISWPDDGWYQVQSQFDYATLCQGVRSCEVDDGRYVVINHTTGERFEGVLVPQTTDDVVDMVETGQPLPEEGEMGSGQLMISPGRITWDVDDWYQVQDANSFITLCEGGRFCTVPPGDYIVINHTTGERWRPVEVPGLDDVPLDDETSEPSSSELPDLTVPVNVFLYEISQAAGHALIAINSDRSTGADLTDEQLNCIASTNAIADIESQIPPISAHYSFIDCGASSLTVYGAPPQPRVKLTRSIFDYIGEAIEQGIDDIRNTHACLPAIFIRPEDCQLGEAILSVPTIWFTSAGGRPSPYAGADIEYNLNDSGIVRFSNNSSATPNLVCEVDLRNGLVSIVEGFGGVNSCNNRMNRVSGWLKQYRELGRVEDIFNFSG